MDEGSSQFSEVAERLGTPSALILLIFIQSEAPYE
jgi:hypothetical protein